MTNYVCPECGTDQYDHAPWCNWTIDDAPVELQDQICRQAERELEGMTTNPSSTDKDLTMPDVPSFCKKEDPKPMETTLSDVLTSLEIKEEENACGRTDRYPTHIWFVEHIKVNIAWSESRDPEDRFFRICLSDAVIVYTNVQSLEEAQILIVAIRLRLKNETNPKVQYDLLNGFLGLKGL